MEGDDVGTIVGFVGVCDGLIDGPDGVVEGVPDGQIVGTSVGESVEGTALGFSTSVLDGTIVFDKPLGVEVGE